MSFIGIQVPSNVGRLLTQIEVPGPKESVDLLHVTLLYLGEDLPIETLAQAVLATYKVTSQVKPFTVSTDHVSSFTPSEHGCPIICPVSSLELHRLQGWLRDSFDEAGIEYSKKHPTYRPHVTLSYSPDPLAGEAVEGLSFPIVEWGVTELVLWGGDNGGDKFTCTFPFTLGANTLYRAFVRMAQTR